MMPCSDHITYRPNMVHIDTISSVISFFDVRQDPRTFRLCQVITAKQNVNRQFTELTAHTKAFTCSIKTVSSVYVLLSNREMNSTRKGSNTYKSKC